MTELYADLFIKPKKLKSKKEKECPEVDLGQIWKYRDKIYYMVIPYNQEERLISLSSGVYKNFIEKATVVVKKKEEVGEWIGKVGRMFSMAVEVTTVKDIGKNQYTNKDTTYVRMTGIKDPNSVLVWFTDSDNFILNSFLRVKKRCTIGFKVKKHDVYMGVKQTTITDVKIILPERKSDYCAYHKINENKK